MAAMIQHRVTNHAEMEKIDGVGAARMSQYANEFLQLLNSIWQDEVGDHAS